MSGFLFPVVIDFIMKRTTNGELSEIRLGFKTKLKEVSFASDLALPLSRFHEKIQRLV